MNWAVFILWSCEPCHSWGPRVCLFACPKTDEREPGTEGHKGESLARIFMSVRTQTEPAAMIRDGWWTDCSQVQATGCSAAQDIPRPFVVPQKFITVFTAVSRCALCWARWNQSTPSYPLSLRCIVIATSQHLLQPYSHQILRQKFVCMYHFCLRATCQFHNLYSSSNVIRMIKSRRMRLAGNVARMGQRGMHTGFGWESQNEKTPVGRSSRGEGVDNIKMDLR
jgi:hypothetical protein